MTWKLIAALGLAWTVGAFSVAGSVLSKQTADFPHPTYLILLFPAVGLLLLWTAYRQYREWQRFGPLKLGMDPYPGAIGGDVGGSVFVPVPPKRLGDLRATLSCVEVSMSGGGKNRSRTERITWRRRARTRTELAANGARISFVVRTDPGLPDANSSINSGHHWILHLLSKDGGVDRNFDLPVFDTGYHSQSRLPIDPELQTTDPLQFPADTVRVEHGTEGLKLDYPPSRGGRSGIMLTAVGLLFSAIGVFMAMQAMGVFDPRESSFAIGTTSLMALVFFPAGAALTTFGLYLWLNRLQVTIGPQVVLIRRSIGPFRRQRELPRAQLGAIDKALSSQAGQGAKATVYYQLKASTSDGTLTLGDGIEGQPLADGLLTLIRQELENVAPIPLPPLPAPRQQLASESATRAWNSIQIFKWLGRIIAVVILVLFAMRAFNF